MFIDNVPECSPISPTGSSLRILAHLYRRITLCHKVFRNGRSYVVDLTKPIGLGRYRQ